MNPARLGRGEQEPLLGRPGDASQPEGKGLQFNLVMGKCSGSPRLLPARAVLSVVLTSLASRNGCSGTDRHLDRGLTMSPTSVLLELTIRS